MLWAAVPEAAIHEHGKLLLREGEVELSNNGIVPSPAGDAIGTE